MAERAEVEEPTVELADYDPEQPLMNGWNGYTKFRWQKTTKTLWISMAAKIIGAITILILSITLWRVIRHRLNKSARKSGLKHFLFLPLKFSSNAGDSNVKYLDSEFFQEFKSKRVQIRYGPFNVPQSSIDGGMRHFMTQDFVPPCADCLITWMQAALEYSDGSQANANTGLWLHHTLLINTKEHDTLECSKSGQRFFASGNERTVADICLSG